MFRAILKAKDVEAKIQNTDIRFLRLWDLYNGLLTPTQREITNLYFNCDLSLGEIAEQKGVSRQSVSDCLNKCKRQLEETEKKLGFVQILDELSLDYSSYLTKVHRWAEEQKEKHPEWIRELEVLQNVTGNDAEIIEIEE